MDAKYQEMVDTLVADLLSVYMKHLEKTKDEYEYVSIVLAAMVFDELAEIEYKRTVERDTDDDPDDICKLMREKAVEMAKSMRNNFLQKTMN